jgi:hypothetical protein
MTPMTMAPSCSPETTDLERRVLAHERVLQALIAYMSRTEPRFLDHLRERFVEHMTMTRHEHDYRDVDDYSEEFIRAVILIEEKRAKKMSNKLGGATPASVPEAEPATGRMPCATPHPDRVQLKERTRVWEVTVDGVFWGDYHQKEHALAAMAAAKRALE